MDFLTLTISDKIAIGGSVITIASMIMSIAFAIWSYRSKTKSETYYKKAKDMSKFAIINKSHSECKKIIDEFSNLFNLVNIDEKSLRGKNFSLMVKERAICIDSSLQEIRQAMASEHWREVEGVLTIGIGFQKYIDSLLDGTAVEGNKFRDTEMLRLCKEKANEIYDKIKELAENLENDLK